MRNFNIQIINYKNPQSHSRLDLESRGGPAWIPAFATADAGQAGMTRDPSPPQADQDDK